MIYPARLKVTDGAGNEVSKAIEVRVRDTLVPVPVTLEDMVARTGESVTFDATGSYDNVGIVNWTWMFEEDGRSVALEGMTVEHTFESPGEYMVTLTVEDAEGNLANHSFIVTVESNAWMYGVLAAVVVAVAVAALMVLRWRKGPGSGDEVD
jgi:plastocyanin